MLKELRTLEITPFLGTDQNGVESLAMSPGGPSALPQK